MKKCLMVGFALVLGVTFSSLGHAAKHKLSGTYSYSTSGTNVKGPCPKGKDTSGKLKIKQKGDAFKLEFFLGQICRPESLCKYSGTISGDKYSAVTKADLKGGKLANTITFTAESKSAAKGKFVSSFSKKGVTCTWTANMVLLKQ